MTRRLFIPNAKAEISQARAIAYGLPTPVNEPAIPEIEPIGEDLCPICIRKDRLEIDLQILMAHDDDNQIAATFGLTGKLIRVHRLSGHLKPDTTMLMNVLIEQSRFCIATMATCGEKETNVKAAALRALVLTTDALLGLCQAQSKPKFEADNVTFVFNKDPSVGTRIAKAHLERHGLKVISGSGDICRSIRHQVQGVFLPLLIHSIIQPPYTFTRSVQGLEGGHARRRAKLQTLCRTSSPTSPTCRERGSVSPEIFEPAGRQFGVAHRVLNVLVAEIKLDRPRILAGVREVIARGVAQHVRMNRKPVASGLRGYGNDVMHRAPRHRAAA